MYEIGNVIENGNVICYDTDTILILSIANWEEVKEKCGLKEMNLLSLNVTKTKFLCFETKKQLLT